MTLFIAGLGVATPTRSIAQHEAAEVAQSFVHGESANVALLPVLYRMTQVKRRGSVILDPPNGESFKQSFYSAAESPEDRGPTTAQRMQRYAMEAAPLAIEAAKAALADANVSSDEITHIVNVSCTGFHAPGVEFELIRSLELSPKVQRANVGFMGCHGAFNGLGVANAFALTRPDARVLMCSVELCSLHYYYGWDSEKVVANALFADGAAAIVGLPESDETNSKDGSWHLKATDSFVLPESNDDMSWNVGDNGFEMTLSTNVPSIIVKHAKPWLTEFLAKHNLTIDQVGSWAIHPGGPRIVAGVAEALELPKDATDTSKAVLAEHGNMSSATVLFVLQRLREQKAKLPCVALGFGPGLVAEAALFE